MVEIYQVLAAELAEALGSNARMVDCTSSEAGSHELLSMREAIFCSRVAVTFRTSKEFLSSKTYSTWVLSSPKSLEILQDCTNKSSCENNMSDVQ